MEKNAKDIKKDKSEEKKSNKKDIIKKMLFVISFIILFIIMNNISNHIVKLGLYAITYILMYIFLLSNNEFKIMSVPSLFSIFHMVYIGLCLLFKYSRLKILHENQYNIILMSYFIFVITNYLVNNLLKSKLEKCKKTNKKMDGYSKKYNMICIAMIVFSLIAAIVYLIINFNYLFGGDMENGRVSALQGNRNFSIYNVARNNRNINAV